MHQNNLTSETWSMFTDNQHVPIRKNLQIHIVSGGGGFDGETLNCTMWDD